MKDLFKKELKELIKETAVQENSSTNELILKGDDFNYLENAIVDLLSIHGVSISFIDQIKKQIEYHKKQETNRSKVKDYSQAIYHDNRRGALEDLLTWIKLNEC